MAGAAKAVPYSYRREPRIPPTPTELVVAARSVGDRGGREGESPTGGRPKRDWRVAQVGSGSDEDAARGLILAGSSGFQAATKSEQADTDCNQKNRIGFRNKRYAINECRSAIN